MNAKNKLTWQNRVDEIMDNFDFGTVQRVMKLLKWKWTKDGKQEIPTVSEMRQCARRLIWDVINSSNDTIYCKTGGFAARRYNETIELAFEVENYDATQETETCQKNLATDKLRGTGRTTRMLVHAEQLTLNDQIVYIIVASDRDVQRLKTLCNNPNIRFATPETFPNFNWERMHFDTYCLLSYTVLVDHHVIETKFAKMLKMLHAYDKSE